jgi:hypothetical protein
LGPLILRFIRHNCLISFRSIAAASASLSFALLAGCGATANMTAAHSTVSSEGTSVTVLATSTANDRLSAFNVQVSSVTLTSQSGKTVSLISSPVNPEFIHLNGIEEPLATVSVPQDTYTSATVTVDTALFICTDFQTSRGLQNTTYEDSQVPASSVSVTLPSPITVTGMSMALSLDLQVSQSASFSSCQGGNSASFAITPTFTLAATTLASSNNRATGLHGLINSLDGGAKSLSVAGADGPKQFGPSWQIETDGNTLFQGVSGFAQLTANMPVDMDVVIQSDGSLLASRVSVYDTNTTTLNVFSGPLNAVVASPSQFSVLSQEQQGYLDKSTYYLGALAGTFNNNVEYQTSGAVANLQTLPFPASFGSTNMVAGQNVSITSHVSSFASGSLPVATVTLMPQTINGTVSSISSEGAFTTYTVALAGYDLFPNLAAQPGQTTFLSNPQTVVVYADSNTRMSNVNTLAPGAVFRFNGLVFNDGGTLRMDCAQINDGVDE